MPQLLLYLPLKNRRHCYGVKPGQALFLLLFIFFSLNLFGQEESGYDEVPVLFSVPRLGHTEITALIKNEEAWIPLKEVFDYLKIKNTASANHSSLSGFFIDPKATYLIDKNHNRIEYQGKVLDVLSSDLVQTETNLYLRLAVFCKVFELDCEFSFRNLSFTLNTHMELPALREMQQEQMRKNLSQLKGEKKADTVLQRRFRFLHFGMADWAVTSMQQTNRANYLRANLAVGATVAGGEASMHLNYYSGQPFQPGKQYYRWRYVNNDFSLAKQISLGQITTPTISSIFAPLNGIQITNTPTTYRKSFGSYRYTGTTEPEWMVELYVNNILVDYAKADASGFFAFEIPIVYGHSSIRLKFYGPWGEENTREENITIPFNFLPVRQLEYTLSAGVIQDASHSRFSRIGFNYGLSRRITLGAGTEYLSSAMQGKPMPFVNTSVRLMDALILNGEYAHGVRSKATLNYRLPSGLQLDLSYIKYDKEQTAFWYNYIEERKASLTAPLRLKNVKAFSRFTYNQFILSKLRYSNAEFLLSAAVAGVSTNLRTYAQYNGVAKPYVYSNLSLSLRLPYGIRFSPQAQYQYDQKGFGLLKAEAEKKISDKGYLNLSYENNRYLHNSSFTLGLRFDLPFARTFFSASRGHKISSATQSASGSLIYERKGGYLDASNQAHVGRGGFLVVPFLDLNCNGQWDKNEPRVGGLRLRVNGGRVERRSDSSLLITGLEAYTSYLIELDNSSFDNIAWQIKKAVIKATVEPNQLRLIEVPVAVVGEASGMVYLKTSRQQKGLSRILVNFFDSSHKLVAHTLTESDGYFSFLGLAPGRYTAQIDSAQLGILNLIATPRSFSFQIAGSEEGTIADGFEFVVQPLFEDQDQQLGTTGPKPSVVNPSGTAKMPFSQEAQSLPESAVQKKPQEGTPQGKDTANKTPGQRSEDSLYGKPGQIKVPNNGRKVDTLIYRPRASKTQSQPLIRKNQKRVPVNKERSSLTRKELLSGQQLLQRKHRLVSQQINRLLKEQQELIQHQRGLIEEIRQLKLRLLQNKKGKASDKGK